MKELSIEEKAKAYDKVSKEVKDFFEGRQKMYNDVTQTLEYLFPELKESEDERTRKELITHCKNTRCVTEEGAKRIVKWIAWLEKQEVTDEEIIFRPVAGTDIRIAAKQALEKIDTGKKVVLAFNGAYIPVNGKTVGEIDSEYDAWLEKQGKNPQGKSALEAINEEKVEPKFHEGDWIIGDKDNSVHQVKTAIENVSNGKYAYDLIDGGYISTSHESDYRLWTIQDAKDGDVLVSESNCGLNTWYCIFKSLDDDESMTVHCYLARDGRFQTMEELCFNKDPRNVKPATKEQRDLLFQKIKESGYEWDDIKKELKKIEQNPTWSEEDDYNLQCMIAKVTSDIQKGSVGRNQELIDWLYSLKDRVQPQLKQGWSEEDENRINRLIAYFEDKESFTAEDDIVYANWLKSIKERYTWKPSDEQMDALLVKIPTENSCNKVDNILKSLYSDLKKLK